MPLDVITSRFVIDPAHPALPGHFPGSPIVPAAVLIERIETELARSGKVLLGLERMKFLHPVSPGDAVDLSLGQAGESAGTVDLRVGGTLVARGRWLSRPA